MKDSLLNIPSIKQLDSMNVESNDAVAWKKEIFKNINSLTETNKTQISDALVFLFENMSEKIKTLSGDTYNEILIEMIAADDCIVALKGP